MSNRMKLSKKPKQKPTSEWGSSEKVGEMGKKKITVDLKAVSPTELRENL